jgi:hypothetical protein
MEVRLRTLGSVARVLRPLTEHSSTKNGFNKLWACTRTLPTFCLNHCQCLAHSLTLSHTHTNHSRISLHQSLTCMWSPGEMCCLRSSIIQPPINGPLTPDTNVTSPKLAPPDASFIPSTCDVYEIANVAIALQEFVR